jgi:hypothetical protein
MANWTLADIRNKVRKVTGRLTPQELSNEQLDKYINQYYQFTFPAEVKLNKDLVYYKFTTVANQAYYDYPDGYTNFLPPVWVDFMAVNYYQSPDYFYEQNPLQVTNLTPWTGDGSTTVFTTTVQAFPIFPGTTIISDNVENFTDVNQDWTTANVPIVGTEGGSATINYSTGVINVTFATAPIDGQAIYLTYVLFQPGRPIAVLAFNNQFQFFPPPNTAYPVWMQAYKVVDPLVNATDRPGLDEWGPTIAYGAARNIHSDYGEMDAYRDVTGLYKEQVEYILIRTQQDLLSTRATPNF